MKRFFASLMPKFKSKFKNYGKILGAGILGAIVGFYFSSAAQKGLENAFPREEVETWGILLWGDHWILRLIVSLLSTAIGGFVVGLVVPNSPKLAGTFSALPTVLSFIAGGTFALINLNKIGTVSMGSWFTISAISVLSIPIARFVSGLGANWRKANEQLFGQPKRLLGFHWSVYLWLWLPYQILIGEFAFTLYFLVPLSLTDEVRLVIIFGRPFIWFGFLILTYGMYSGLKYLMKGKHLGLTRLQVVGKVLLSIVVLPAIAIGLRTGGFLLLSIEENLPPWAYTIVKIALRILEGLAEGK